MCASPSASSNRPEILDFEQPIALSLVALLHFVADEDSPYELVRQLVDALPSGSYLVLSQLTADFDPLAVQRGVDMYAAGGVTLVPRSRDGGRPLLRGA